MGIFSFFSKSKSKVSKKNYQDAYFSKELVLEIFNHSDTMTLIFTKKDGWIGANKALLDTFSLKDIEEFNQTFQSVRDLFFSESEEVFTEDDKSWLDYIKNHKKDGYQILIFSCKDERVDIDAKCYTIEQDKEYYILELKDITTEYKAQSKINEAEKLQSKFLTNIGQEFRTPMNGILGFVELLNQTELDRVQNEYLHLINRSSRNLLTNIETLLDLSQMQGGRLKVENSKFSLLQDMEQVAYNLWIQGKEKGIVVLSFIDPKLPQELSGDFKKIKQIMNSLIQNAIKFTENTGKIIVEIKLLNRQVNGDCRIGFSVKDNGDGLNSEQISQITDPFNASYQSDDRLSIGVSLSYGLVKLLGSELKIHSEEGHGSHFSFSLDFKTSKGQSYKMIPKKRVRILLLDPTMLDDANFLTIYLRSFSIDVSKANVLNENVYDGIDTLYIVANQNDSSWMLKLGTYSKKVPVILLLDEAQKLQTKFTHVIDNVIRKPLLPSFVAKHLNNMHSIEVDKPSNKKLKTQDKVSVLIVEDNFINQKLIQIILKEYNISVSTASDGFEAIELCKKQGFDLIFMDIDMPGKNGIVTTQEIKADIKLNRLTPIVALTAMAMDGDKEMLLNEGLDDYLAKPITRHNLEDVLDKYIKVTSI